MSGYSGFMGGSGPNITPFSLGKKWINACQMTKAGPIPNLYNTCLALRNDPAWAGKIRYDEMLRSPVVDGVPMSDPVVIACQEWLQENGLKRVGKDTVRDAISHVSRDNSFHPLRERLDGLEWDGVPRLTEWLIECLGAEDNEYHRQISFRFPIAMVARVYRPGCKADNMIVLEGPQGALKSQAIEALATPYYSDNLPDLGADPIRLSMHLRGKWLIEVSELNAFASNKIESAHLKAFITRKEEIYTPKFGHHEVIEPRQCLLCGTTNDDQYLKDETGGRRFWPVKCGVIKLDKLRAAVDQLLAEAVEEFRKDTPWWLENGVEEAFFKPQQAARQWVDAVEPQVRSYLLGKTRVLLMEVATDLGFTANRFTVQDQRRLASVLRHLGWELKRSTNARYWEKV